MNVCCIQLVVVTERRARIQTGHMYATVPAVIRAVIVRVTQTTASQVCVHFVLRSCLLKAQY